MVKTKKDEEYWENWAENFGKRMEKWGEEFGDDMECKFSCGNNGSIGGFIFGLFILIWGIIWLGNDLSWWNIVLPFWPLIVILLGLGFILGEIKKLIK